MNTEFVPLGPSRGEYTPAQIRAISIQFGPAVALALVVTLDQRVVDPGIYPTVHSVAVWMVTVFAGVVLVQGGRIVLRLARQLFLATGDRVWTYFGKRNGGTGTIEPKGGLEGAGSVAPADEDETNGGQAAAG